MSAFRIRALDNESGRTILNLLKFFNELFGAFLTKYHFTKDVTRVLVALTVRTCLTELILRSSR